MLLSIVGIQSGCEDHDPINADGLTGPANGSTDNEPPETYLSVSLSPGQLPDTTTSWKTMNWWGEDPDGRIESYRYRWGQLIDTTIVWYDTLWNEVSDTSWTDTNDETAAFILPIRTLYANFIFQVRAVDNSNAIDPEPASVQFPIVNSPPTIAFRDGANPVDPNQGQFVTFPVRSFVWDATDPDGNESIDKVSYVLDPVPGDTTWIEIPGGENSLTLVSEDLAAGEHTIFFKVSDVAGLESPYIRFPDPDNAGDPSSWLVKEPQGDYLIIDDYALDSNNDKLEFYTAIFDSIIGEAEVDYSIWELGTQLPYVTQDVTETLLMFKKVLLYSHFGTPLISRAFSSVSTFLSQPDNQLLITTAYLDTNMYSGMADSIYIYSNRMSGTEEDPILMQPVDDPLMPEIEVQNAVLYSVRAFIPSPGVDVIYKLDPSTRANPVYEGEPIIGLRRPDRKYTLISIPLYETVDRSKVTQIIQNTFD